MTSLTDEELCDQMPLTPSTTGQTANDELYRLRSALSSYRVETLQWAERRSATQASLVPAARRSERWAALPQWSLATIAIVTIAAGVAHLSDVRGNAGAAAPVTAVQETRSSADEIAADNKLLHSIDTELNYHVRSPVDAFDLKHLTPEPRQSSAASGSED